MPRLALIAVAALLALAAPSPAATPRAGQAYDAHDHHTDGRNWHVQLEVNHGRTRLGTLVVYSQACQKTAFASAIRLHAGGRFSVDRKLPGGGGRWRVHARFVNAHVAKGAWSLSAGGCEDGHSFSADDKDIHYMVGNLEDYPSSGRMLGWPGAGLRRLADDARRRSHRFDTPAKAAAHGYVIDGPKGCPGFHHARKHGATMWGSVLDPARPQALMFHCDSRGRYQLAAYMFRAPGDRRPDTFHGLVQWHRHSSTRRATWMLHLWLVPDPVAAFATCVPYNEFARAHIFRYVHPKVPAANSSACADTVT